MVKFTIASAVLGALVLGGASAARAAEPADLKPGQVWTLKDTSDARLRLQIVRIEPWDQGRTVAHVRLTGVPCPPKTGCETTVIGHAPFDIAALAKGLDRLESSGAGEPESFAEGYAAWNAAKGGVFTIGPSEAVKAVIQAIPAKP